MKELKLIGNATRDRISLGRMDTIEKLGGVHTISRHLNIEHEKYFTQDSLVDVYMGLSGVKFHSMWQSVYDRIEEPDEYPETNWSHISYLDILNLDMAKVRRSTTGCISADLCGAYPTKELWLRMRFVDFLIVNLDQWFEIRTIVNPVRTTVVARSKDKIYWGQNEFPNKYIQAQNVVGAGDVFVAEFLNCISPKSAYPTKNMVKDSGLTQSEIISRCVDASVKYLESEGNPWADTISLSQ